MTKRQKIWWILFKTDPMGYIVRRIRDSKIFINWVNFLCRHRGHKTPLVEKFTGSYCSRCGIMVVDRRRGRFYVTRN